MTASSPVSEQAVQPLLQGPARKYASAVQKGVQGLCKKWAQQLVPACRHPGIFGALCSVRPRFGDQGSGSCAVLGSVPRRGVGRTYPRIEAAIEAGMHCTAGVCDNVVEITTMGARMQWRAERSIATLINAALQHLQDLA